MWRTLCKKALLFYSHSHCRSRWGELMNAVFLRVTTPPNDFFFLNRIQSKLSVGLIQKVSHTHAQWAQIPPLSTNCTGWQFNPHMLRCPWERHWTPGYSLMAGKSNFFRALKTPENGSLYWVLPIQSFVILFYPIHVHRKPTATLVTHELCGLNVQVPQTVEILSMWPCYKQATGFPTSTECRVAASHSYITLSAAASKSSAILSRFGALSV